MKPFNCFACGFPMKMWGMLSGWCDACQVQERREPRFSMTATVTYQDWCGERLYYIDHGTEHCPSPG
jgi:hypothetical protein